MSTSTIKAELVTTGYTDGYIRGCQASHFLSKATMGSTRGEITTLANRIGQIGYREACEEWIDAQFALPRGGSMLDDAFYIQQSHVLNPISLININNFEYAWWNQVITSDEKLRQRMAFALSQIFVTSSNFWTNHERRDIWRVTTQAPFL